MNDIPVTASEATTVTQAAIVKFTQAMNNITTSMFYANPFVSGLGRVTLIHAKPEYIKEIEAEVRKKIK